MQSEDNLILEPYPISAMRNVLDCIEKKRNIRVDIGRIPLDDRETLELFKKGDTDGVFGFDAPDIQEYSKQLKPDSFDELMILGALCGPARAFRPATSELITEYIDRKRGEWEYSCIQPDVEPIISATRGMIIYQEQVTEILCKIAGYTPKAAETARRILAKKNPEKIAKLEPEFFCRCVAKGYNQQIALQIWDLLLQYAKNAVCKTLVSIYTFVTYQFAYLKAHYESEFCAAINGVK